MQERSSPGNYQEIIGYIWSDNQPNFPRKFRPKKHVFSSSSFSNNLCKSSIPPFFHSIYLYIMIKCSIYTYFQDLSKKNSGFEINLDIANLLFLIYENCCNSEFKDIWFKNLISEWKFYSSLSEESYSKLISRFVTLIKNISIEIPRLNINFDHFYFLRSMLIYLDCTKSKIQSTKNLSLAKFSLNLQNPLKIYKELIEISEISKSKIQEIFIAFVELLQFSNSPKSEISYLSIFKSMFVKIQNEGNGGVVMILNRDIIDKICEGLLIKFSQSKFETKNDILEIIFLVVDHMEGAEITDSGCLGWVFQYISEEINHFVKKFFEENENQRKDLASNLSLSEAQRGSIRSSVKSKNSNFNRGDAPTTPVKKRLIYNTSSSNKSVKYRKNMNININLINSESNSMIREPQSSKASQMKSFKFNSQSYKSSKNNSSRNRENSGKLGGGSKLLINEIQGETDLILKLPSPQKKVKGFRNRRMQFMKKKELTLDTDEINKLFNFGGEKGTKFAK